MHSGLALFDFDGTLTNRDSFIDFIKFYKGKFSFIIGFVLLLPVLVLFKLRVLKNSEAKEIVLTYFFKNTPLQAFQEKCNDFGTNVIPGIIKPSALKAIHDHLQKGDRVIIITASAENWLSHWCSNMGVELISTQLEVKDGLLTGKILGANCYGMEKILRLKRYLRVEDYKEIYAYGDSKGDLPMLELAGHKFYKAL